MRQRVAPQRPQLIETENPDAVGIIVISSAKFFKEVVDKFDFSSGRTDFVDATVDYHIKNLAKFFDNSMSMSSCNTDKLPYYHVQSIGYVAAIDEYVDSTEFAEKMQDRPSDFIANRDENIWGSIKNKLLSVNIHPRYGGWYAYRMLLVLHSGTWPDDIPQPAPLHFLSPKEKRIVIKEYNKHPDLGRWRDFHDVSTGRLQKYETHQYLFFHETSTDKRRRILELLKQDTSIQSRETRK